MGTSKDILARVSRGIEHIQVQDAECSSTNRKCIISSPKAPLTQILRNLSFPAVVVKIVQLSVHLSTALVVRFGFQSAMGTSKDTLARVSRGIEHIQVQDAECSSTNRKCIISSPKAPLTQILRNLSFPAVVVKSVQLSVHLSTALVVRFGFQSAMGTSKDTLARVSRGIEHIQVQDAECSSTNRKCIISSPKAPLHKF